MCHNAKHSSPAAIIEVKSETNHTQHCSKSAIRINPFRRIAKTARINLNRYWSLLSKLNKNSQGQDESSDIEVTFAAEMEQNRINELLEERVRLSSPNSMTSGYQLEPEFYGHGLLTNQWESDIYGRGPLLSFHHDTVTPSPPPPMRRIRIAKRSLYSPTFSTSTCYTSNYDSNGSHDSLF